jgi:deleted-in-malignant-brain-tumors protein 1
VALISALLRKFDRNGLAYCKTQWAMLIRTLVR